MQYSVNAIILACIDVISYASCSYVSVYCMRPLASSEDFATRYLLRQHAAARTVWQSDSLEHCFSRSIIELNNALAATIRF